MEHLGFSDEEYKNSGVNFLDNENEIVKILNCCSIRFAK